MLHISTTNCDSSEFTALRSAFDGFKTTTTRKSKPPMKKYAVVWCVSAKSTYRLDVYCSARMQKNCCCALCFDSTVLNLMVLVTKLSWLFGRLTIHTPQRLLMCYEILAFLRRQEKTAWNLSNIAAYAFVWVRDTCLLYILIRVFGFWYRSPFSYLYYFFALHFTDTTCLFC